VMGTLLLGLLGGSAELARCPQIVSFSRATLPVVAAAQDQSATGYQAASFQLPEKTSKGSPMAAHETLLKASMPVERGLRFGEAMTKPRSAVPNPTLARRPSANRAHASRPRQAQRWVVLTSWDGTERRRMVFAVTEERVISTSYAAVPTAGGWLIIQL